MRAHGIELIFYVDLLCAVIVAVEDTNEIAFEAKRHMHIMALQTEIEQNAVVRNAVIANAPVI